MYKYQVLDVKTIMEGFREFELKPHNQKSYYGKAIVIACNNGNTYLQSYETIVCMIDQSGNFKRLWGGYSATTAKHIDSFRRLFNLPGICKREWMEMEVC